MNKSEAFKELDDHIIKSISPLNNKHINVNVAKRVVSDLEDSHKKEIEKLLEKIEYWKRSFNKQVELSRKRI